jgi:hypothetical protein
MSLQIDWFKAITYLELAAIADAIEPQDEYQASDILKIQSFGYKFLNTIYGNELATDIDPHLGEVVTFGFIAINNLTGELVAVLRGTDTIYEWIEDALFLMVKNPITGTDDWTEDGFTSVYLSLSIGRANNSATAKNAIRDLVMSGQARAVTIAGHSLGAALATLLTLDVALNGDFPNPVLYSYGCPRVGDHLFAHRFNESVAVSYRVVNKQDLIPQLPPVLPIPYEQVNTEFLLNDTSNILIHNIDCDHHLTTYLFLIAQITGQAGFPLDADCSN